MPPKKLKLAKMKIKKKKQGKAAVAGESVSSAASNDFASKSKAKGFSKGGGSSINATSKVVGAKTKQKTRAKKKMMIDGTSKQVDEAKSMAKNDRSMLIASASKGDTSMAGGRVGGGDKSKNFDTDKSMALSDGASLSATDVLSKETVDDASTAGASLSCSSKIGGGTASMLTAAGHLKAKENLGTFHTKLIISMDVPTFSICLLLLENAKLKKKSIRTMLREEKSSISYQRLEDFDGTAATKPDDKFEPFLVDNLVLVKVSLEGKTHTHTHTHIHFRFFVRNP